MDLWAPSREKKQRKMINQGRCDSYWAAGMRFKIRSDTGQCIAKDKAWLQAEAELTHQLDLFCTGHPKAARWYKWGHSEGADPPGMPMVIQATVPVGHVDGSPLLVQVPGGAMLHVPLQPGACPGQVIQVSVPSAPVQRDDDVQPPVLRVKGRGAGVWRGTYVAVQRSTKKGMPYVFQQQHAPGAAGGVGNNGSMQAPLLPEVSVSTAQPARFERHIHQLIKQEEMYFWPAGKCCQKAIGSDDRFWGLFQPDEARRVANTTKFYTESDQCRDKAIGMLKLCGGLFVVIFILSRL